jgi:hypothetical protein
MKEIKLDSIKFGSLSRYNCWASSLLPDHFKSFNDLNCQTLPSWYGSKGKDFGGKIISYGTSACIFILFRPMEFIYSKILLSSYEQCLLLGSLYIQRSCYHPMSSACFWALTHHSTDPINIGGKRCITKVFVL